jgi:hypothetical protein
MNEVLTQIAKEAMVEHCISHVRLQAFAELIIKECVSVMSEKGKTYAHPTAGEYQSQLFANVIKEHFGIRE